MKFDFLLFLGGAAGGGYSQVIPMEEVSFNIMKLEVLEKYNDGKRMISESVLYQFFKSPVS